jgi:RND family efflux transporter MFP subunit
MKFFLKIILPLAIVTGALGVFFVMMKNKAIATRVEVPRVVQSVEIITVKAGDVKLSLASQGMIESEKLILIASEVAGRVIKVSPKFNVGEVFDEGETLLEIDSADYQAAESQAGAALADAKMMLANEEARADQALRDWQKLGSGKSPRELVMRKPQIDSATARIKAAEDAVKKSHHDLERTSIKAPFRGRVRAIHTDFGSFLAPGARVAEFYSLGGYEVRLPLSLDDYAFVKTIKGGEPVEVTLAATYGGKTSEWKGTALRTESEIERTSRSVYVIARIVDDGTNAASILMPGLFVRAQIEGQNLKNVFRVPRRAFLDDRRVIIVDGNNKIRVREVQTVRADGADLLVSSGLKDGERVCTTALATAVDGMEVRVINRIEQEAQK